MDTNVDGGFSQEGIRSEELDAQRVALKGRSLALVACAALITIVTPWPGPVYLYGLLFLFGILGWLAYHTAKKFPDQIFYQYLFVTADFALLAFAILYPNPLSPADLPPQFTLRFGSAMYFFLLICALAYVYRPQLILWGGVSAAICWAVAVGVLLSQPETIWREPAVENTDEGAIAFAEVFLDVHFVSLDVRIQEIGLFLICAALLSLSVRRSKKLLERQVQTARERENLSRYFPRKTADLLASAEETFDRPREHNAAVMFVDLVSFTNWAHGRNAADTIAFLREVHSLIADIVFRHDGTLDKFIGDGVMATFGTPDPGDDDPVRAVLACLDILDGFAEQNRTPGDRPNISVGLHYGPVVIGNVGNPQRLEFAVLGDTVNVASRLEHMTRETGCSALISQEVIAAFPNGPEADLGGAFHRLKKTKPLSLRGVPEKLVSYRVDSALK